MHRGHARKNDGSSGVSQPWHVDSAMTSRVGLQARIDTNLFCYVTTMDVPPINDLSSYCPDNTISINYRVMVTLNGRTQQKAKPIRRIQTNMSTNIYVNATSPPYLLGMTSFTRSRDSSPMTLVVHRTSFPTYPVNDALYSRFLTRKYANNDSM